MADLWPLLHREAKPMEEVIDFASPATQICPTCEDDSAIDTVGAEVICVRCGTIVDVPLEQSAEYRWFSSESAGADPSRCGFPVNHLMPESSLGTMILVKNQSPLMRRIKRYHMWNLMPYRERTLWTIFESLQVRASNAGISTAVLEEAKELFAQLTVTAICRGQKQRDAMLSACLWESLKRHETPRMPKDIAEIFNIELSSVTKGIKQFQHLFAIRTSGQLTDTYANQATKTKTKVEKATETKAPETEPESDEVISARAFERRAIWQKTASRTTSYEDFIVPFLTNLSVSRTSLEGLVRHVCARTEELGIVPENTPPSLTASVIAFCALQKGVRLDIAEIARICGISAVTIQKCLKRMMPWKEKLLEQ
jgi:transcription initiation factor TFIIIB Brf1 subunit/transcription initiation factor TFIIB